MHYNMVKFKLFFLALSFIFLGNLECAVSSSLPPRPEQTIKGAHWFGRAWPTNFWTTNLDRYADHDFNQLRADGFNAVVLPVPWLGFVDPNTGAINEHYFGMLDTLIKRAELANLKVIMRVGYAWNAGIPDNEEHIDSLFISEQEQKIWLGYISELDRRYGSDQRVVLFFLSWEDFWRVTRVTNTTIDERLSFSKKSGFSSWLKNRMTLKEVSDRYGQRFTEWDQVPLPKRDQPAFELFLDFFKSRYVNDFFLKASERLPRLSAEVRVDQDPIFDGEKMIKSYDWSDSWNLPRAEWVTIYYNPYFGSDNSGKEIEPSIAARNLTNMLEHVHSVVHDKHIFIDQLNIRDDTPGLHNDYVKNEQLPEFLSLAVQPITRYTDGYAVWTYFAYSHNAFSNPDFALGLDGWKPVGDVTINNGQVILSSGASIERPFRRAALQSSVPGSRVRLCVTTEGTGFSNIIASVNSSDESLKLPIITSGLHCGMLSVQDAENVRITALGDKIVLVSVSISNFSQSGTIYNEDGSPAFLLKPIQHFNNELWSPTLMRTSEQPSKQVDSLQPDSWMGLAISGKAPNPSTSSGENLLLRVQTFLPENWPIEANLTVTSNGREVQAPCSSGVHQITLELGNYTGPVEYKITADKAESPARLGIGQDSRYISCIIQDVSVETAQHSQSLKIAQDIEASSVEGNGRIYPDSWMGIKLVGHADSAIETSSKEEFSFDTFLPDTWPIETPLNIEIDGVVTRSACRKGLNTVHVPVTSRSPNRVNYTISALHAQSPIEIGFGQDSRALSCVIRNIRLENSAISDTR